jgi:hypothetical protein
MLRKAYGMIACRQPSRAVNGFFGAIWRRPFCPQP